MEGTVKWYNMRKGYGFIQGEDGEDYFVHHSALSEVRFIRENDKVSFEAVDTDKGKQAQKVVLLQKGSEAEGAGEAPAEAEAPAEEPKEEFGEEASKEPADAGVPTEEEPKEPLE
jgi:CspA family cold shock protein